VQHAGVGAGRVRGRALQRRVAGAADASRVVGAGGCALRWRHARLEQVATAARCEPGAEQCVAERAWQRGCGREGVESGEKSQEQDWSKTPLRCGKAGTGCPPCPPRPPRRPAHPAHPAPPCRTASGVGGARPRAAAARPAPLPPWPPPRSGTGSPAPG
jgi:hypothetical protein